MVFGLGVGNAEIGLKRLEGETEGGFEFLASVDDVGGGLLEPGGLLALVLKDVVDMIRSI